MQKRKLASFLLLQTTLLATPALASTDTTVQLPPTQVASEATKAPRGAQLGSRAEEERYSKLEAASPDAQKYKAGDVIVISATAVAIVLLVVLVLILL